MTKKGTEYVIACAIGGYGKMLDETEESVPKEEYILLITCAAVLQNFSLLSQVLSLIFCAFILYWLIYMIGFTTIKPLIGTIEPNSLQPLQV